jgi:exonuclease SbcC
LGTRHSVQQSLTALATRINAAIELADAVGRESAAAALALEQRSEAVAASQHAHHLVERRFAGMAASLAAELSPGSPCPVCGSVEHPQLAVATSEEVKAEEVRAAQESARFATTRAESATAVQASIGTEVAKFKAVAQGDLPDLQEQQRVQSLELASLDQAVIDLQRVASSLDELQRNLDQWSRDANTAAAEVASHEAQLQTATAHLNDLRRQVDERRGTFESVGARLAATRDSESQLTRLVAGQEAVGTAVAALESRLADRSDVLASQQFDSIETARSAIRDNATIDLLEAALAKYRTDVETVERALAEDDVRDVDLGVNEDLEPLVEAVSAAEAQSVAANSAATLTSSAHTLSSQRHDALKQAVDDSREVFDGTAVTIRMADLVAASPGSANQELMPLTSFVLRERFRAVVDAANTRLRTLSDGRFELRHSEDREGGLRRTGLGLRVLDNDNGALRDPKSLSGGETFYTSLALALGLSDEVVGSRGGVTLGTLFIDEGFGSLDPDRLEDVLDVLHRLQEGGRVIGVISHVSEMKEAIPARIEVRPTRGQGSSVTVRT